MPAPQASRLSTPAYVPRAAARRLPRRPQTLSLRGPQTLSF